MSIITTKSARETINLGLKLAKKCRGGEIFALLGQLGSGKTCLAKGLAQGLGIKHTVNSPTFILMNVYQPPSGKIKFFCHTDLYRLKRESELEEIGLKEYLGRPDTVTVIEWADKIPRLLKRYKTQQMEFTFIDKNIRQIKIN